MEKMGSSLLCIHLFPPCCFRVWSCTCAFCVVLYASIQKKNTLGLCWVFLFMLVAHYFFRSFFFFIISIIIDASWGEKSLQGKKWMPTKSWKEAKINRMKAADDVDHYHWNEYGKQIERRDAYCCAQSVLLFLVVLGKMKWATAAEGHQLRRVVHGLLCANKQNEQELLTLSKWTQKNARKPNNRRSKL